MKFPISGQAIELARKLAGKKYRFPDDETAVAELLERWHLGLGLTMAERRIALRQAREQSVFDLPATEDDDIRTLPSVARIFADARALDEETVEGAGVDEAEPYEGLAPSDDDEEDELDGPDAADDFYADALEDA
ncbi:MULTISPECIES: hypothetical protein, partial [Streptomycetaceae]|uniref:Transposase n=1 Tax=Streptantibioticus cattleyicolor (strain ATCC 35852 / DSM 46488 / JCM 4925 / NBRC 14057 / NRRL 8057) TaxID=1003195 RepID=F8JTF9_STREN